MPPGQSRWPAAACGHVSRQCVCTGTGQDRREIAEEAFNLACRLRRRRFEPTQQVGRQFEPEDSMIRQILHHRGEANAHARFAMSGERRRCAREMREMIDAGGNAVADHLGSADQDREPDRLVIERAAIGHGIERPGLERQAVLGSSQYVAIGMRVRIDEAWNEDLAVAGNDLVSACASSKPLSFAAQNGGDAASVDSDGSGLRQEARRCRADPDIVDENHRMIRL